MLRAEFRPAQVRASKHSVTSGEASRKDKSTATVEAPDAVVYCGGTGSSRDHARAVREGMARRTSLTPHERRDPPMKTRAHTKLLTLALSTMLATVLPILYAQDTAKP